MEKKTLGGGKCQLVKVPAGQVGIGQLPLHPLFDIYNDGKWGMFLKKIKGNVYTLLPLSWWLLLWEGAI